MRGMLRGSRSPAKAEEPDTTRRTEIFAFSRIREADAGSQADEDRALELAASAGDCGCCGDLRCRFHNVPAADERPRTGLATCGRACCDHGECESSGRGLDRFAQCKAMVPGESAVQRGDTEDRR